MEIEDFAEDFIFRLMLEGDVSMEKEEDYESEEDYSKYEKEYEEEFGEEDERERELERLCMVMKREKRCHGQKQVGKGILMNQMKTIKKEWKI